ncbi:HupE/UreJ family protein [Pseudotabrizicola sp. L79]|uniref:HupE/UreJ family protein n=1 Tax=Pseudotabrizicola sp. L79 TaxID=3118402 RepID=UPI002F94B2D4
MAVPLFSFLRYLALILVMSIAALPARAHEVRPAVADVAIGADTVALTIRLTLEPMLAGMDLAGLEDTNDSPFSDRYDALRAEDPGTLTAELERAWPRLAPRFVIKAGDTLVVPRILTVSVPEVGDVSLPRDSFLVLMADLPADGTPVQIGWDAAFGSLALRQAEGDANSYAALLTGGALSDALPRDTVVDDSAGAVFVRYIVSGFEHIIPKGLDHILFVLGLYFYALRFGPMLAQVTAFTLAHTVTLALASLKIVQVPAEIVEPLIAASIVYVAVENIIGGGRIGPLRVAVVFGFGLLHGLGFASVLGDVGLQDSRFVVGLIGFNIGVELGQLAVILVAFLALGLPFGKKPWYRSAIAVPASCAIAAVGAWWTVERAFF